MSDGRQDAERAFGGFERPSAPPPFAPQAPASPPGVPDATSLLPANAAPGWHPWMALIAPAIGLGLTIVLSIPLALIAVAGRQGPIDTTNMPSWFGLASLVLQDFAFVGAAIFTAAQFSRPRLPRPAPWHFGWRPVRALGPAIGWAALVYLTFVIVTAGWVNLLGQEKAKDTIARDLGADRSTLAAAIVVIFVVVAAPVVEELLFRGLMFGALRTRLGVLPAALLVGVAFGLVHAGGSPAAFLLPLALLGTMLCLLYHRTGSLYPSMGVHAINNSLAVVGTMGWASWLMPVVAVAALCTIALIALAVRRASGPVPDGAPAP